MFIDRPEEPKNLKELWEWCVKLHRKIYEDDLNGSGTWDAASIADGDEEAKEVTVTGAVLGDYAIVSLSVDVADLVLNAQVTAADTVTCILANNTGGAIDLASATVYVRVLRRTL